MKKLMIICAVLIPLSASAWSEKRPDHYKGDLSLESVTEVCNAVCGWQLKNHYKDGNDQLGWIHGAYYRGLMEWAKQKDDRTAFGYFYGFAAAKRWSMSTRNGAYHADEICVGQAYLEMYRMYKVNIMVQDLKERAFYVASHPSQTSIRHDATGTSSLRWTWCDALFMAAPVYAGLYRETGEQVYSDYLEREFWATTEHLYDTDEHLFFRDCNYFGKTEPNGKKIFWGRGNGWVAASLPLILENLPAGYATKDKYEKLLKEMLGAIVACQDEEGAWHASLLDPVTYKVPENSGSAFFCYALAWGLNHGIVSGAGYRKALEKGWASVVSCVNPGGKLGYVQKVGAAPAAVTSDRSELYGSGAMLLAGSEICKLLGEKPAIVTVQYQK